MVRLSYQFEYHSYSYDASRSPGSSSRGKQRYKPPKEAILGPSPTKLKPAPSSPTQGKGKGKGKGKAKAKAKANANADDSDDESDTLPPVTPPGFGMLPVEIKWKIWEKLDLTDMFRALSCAKKNPFLDFLTDSRCDEADWERRCREGFGAKRKTAGRKTWFLTFLALLPDRCVNCFKKTAASQEYSRMLPSGFPLWARVCLDCQKERKCCFHLTLVEQHNSLAVQQLARYKLN